MYSIIGFNFKTLTELKLYLRIYFNSKFFFIFTRKYNSYNLGFPGTFGHATLIISTDNSQGNEIPPSIFFLYSSDTVFFLRMGSTFSLELFDWYVSTEIFLDISLEGLGFFYLSIFYSFSTLVNFENESVTDLYEFLLFWSFYYTDLIASLLKYHYIFYLLAFLESTQQLFYSSKQNIEYFIFL